ncbi:MAG: hypothetical protein C0501_00675 [Isosphaera sp.]|nr:hypothetical protein [Isosphaera sp.]
MTDLSTGWELMRRVALFSCLVAGLIGCGEKNPPAPPGNPDGPPARAPKGDPTKPDLGTEKPKDTARVLSPRATVKTGSPRSVGSDGSFHLSADGTRLAVGVRGGKTQVWDIRGEPKKLSEFAGGGQKFSPDGKLFLHSGKSFDPDVVSAETGSILKTLPYPGRDYAFRTPDVVVGVWRGEPGKEKPEHPEVREYDVSSGRLTNSFPIPSDFGTPLIDLDVRVGLNGGREVAVGGRKSGRVEVWDVTTRKRVREFTVPGPKSGGDAWGIADLRFSADGKWFASPGARPEVFDGRTGAAAATPPPAGLGGYFVPGRDLYLVKVFKPTGNFQTTQGYEAFDITRKAVVAFLSSTGLRVECSADGAAAAAQNEDGEVVIWDLTQLP